MIADRVRKGFRGEHDGGDIDCGFLTARPKPGRGGSDQCVSGDARHGGDKWPPLAGIERCSRGKNVNAPIFLTIAREIAAFSNIHRRRRRDDAFKAAEEALLIALDLNDQVIAGLSGDLKRFFDSAWRQA